MESPRESVNRIVRSRAFIFLVVVLLLVAIISVAMGGGETHEEDGLKAVASASGTLFRTDEDVLFSSEGSTGHIDSYFWDFGDGTTGNGTEVSHAYEMGGWYNVSLTVICASGNNDTAVVTVGVQPEDVHNTRDLGRQRDVRPLWMHGWGLLGDVGPNIAYPTSTLEYDVVRAFGTFTVTVEVWVYSEDRYETTELHREDHTMTGGDLRFSYTVDPEDLPPEAATNYTRVHVTTMIDQGRWASSEIRVDVLFPWDELQDDGD
ncbi:MAG: PKD domain-containing protein [Thermoplasmata archaeon]|nr:MAG: PKD domain-containing protein [Thermoplasmata archaeon]